jgi:hypothetical protein
VIKEKWEIFTPDARSNQTVFRKTSKIEWISKPFGLWQIIEDGVKKRGRESGIILTSWFKNKALEYIRLLR